MNHVNTRAIVLRSRRVGDADRLLDLLTPERGILTAKARHAAKSKKRFVGSLEPFSLGLFALTKRRNEWRTWAIQQVRVEEPFAAIREDLGWYSLACYVCEAVLQAAERDHPSPELFDLVLETLRRMVAREGELARVKLCFELHFLYVLGLLPSLDACVACGAQSDAAWVFHPREAHLFCRACADASSGSGTVLSPGTIRLLNRFIDGAFALEARLSWSAQQRAECLRFASSVFDYHVPHRPKSLAFLKPFLETDGHGEELPRQRKVSRPPPS